MVLSILLGLSFWLERATDVPLLHAPKQARHDPDTLVDNFVLYRHDEKGRLQYRLSAPRMAHFPDDDSTEVTQPLLIHFRPDSSRLILQGETARITDTGKHVLIEKNVVVTRTALGKRAEMTLETPELTVLPEAGLAFNQKPVRIREGASWITGTGLKMDQNTGIFQLRSRVRAEYTNPVEK